jgi:hypothetical protein
VTFRTIKCLPSYNDQFSLLAVPGVASPYKGIAAGSAGADITSALGGAFCAAKPELLANNRRAIVVVILRIAYSS